jgi:hypothetical protein
MRRRGSLPGWHTRSERVALMASIVAQEPRSSPGSGHLASGSSSPSEDCVLEPGLDGDAATDWKYQVSSSLPADGTSCWADGSGVPSLGSLASVNASTVSGTDDVVYDPYFVTALDVDPPFSGSASGTAYFTACYGESDYIVVKMTAELSDCLLWICTATFDSEVVAEEGSGYSVENDTEWLFDDEGAEILYVPDLAG